MNAPPMIFPQGTPGVRDVYATWKSFMGIPQGEEVIPRSLRDFAQQPADEAWVYSCMAVRAEQAQGVPLRVQVWRPDAASPDGGNWVDNAIGNDNAAKDYQFLLDDVNPGWHGTQLQAYMEAGAAIQGGSYLKKVRGRIGGYPQELYWIAGADIEPVMGSSFPTAYTHMRLNDSPETWPASEVIPLRETVNLQNPWKLLSPISAARYEISVNKQAAEWNAALLRNWGIPPMAWVAPKDADFGQQEIGAIRRALRALRGPRNQGKVPILPGGIEPRILSLTQKDADWIASRKVSRMSICAVLGVPLPLAGDDEKNSVYAVVRDAERFLWRRTLIPKLDGRASTFNSWLTPDFDPTRRRIRVAYDYSGIEALQPAPAEAMAQWNEAVKIGVPLNRYIARFGMGAPVEGGDEARILLRQGAIPVEDATDITTLAATGAAPAAGPTPRPETYSTANETGGERQESARAIAALGKGLYQNQHVRAHIAGDADALTALVPSVDVPALAEGIRRRESAEQIARRLDALQLQH